MQVPIFTEVINLTAVTAAMSSMAPEVKAEVQGAIRSLLVSPNGRVGDTIDNNAVEILLRQFGSQGKTPKILQPLLAEGQIMSNPVVDEQGQRAAYIGYAGIAKGAVPDAEDIPGSVVFKVIPTISQENGERMMYPQSAMAGAKCSFLALMSMSCCADDNNKLPLSALIGFYKKDGTLLSNWRPSVRSQTKCVHHLFMDETGKLNVMAARDEHAQQTILHRMLHAGGFGHSCSGHGRLAYTPPELRH